MAVEMEIEIVSKEMIKPSSRTPDHLRRYALSFLDQITVDVYNPMVYFYSAVTATKIIDQLKSSLSDMLSHYYPLAGRANYVDFSIDCNDAGVPFVEARVLNCRLCDVTNTPFPTELNKLIPFQLDELDEVSMGVQLNVFECGGVAVGICISHKIGDALSFINAVNGWAAVCRGETGAPRGLHLTSAEAFPPAKAPVYHTRISILRERAAKRYRIDGGNVEAIRSKYEERKGGENERRVSRLQALSAFLYGRFIAAIKAVCNDKGENESTKSEKKIYFVCHAVNIRPRLDPPLPEYAFGNYYRSTFALPSTEILNDHYCYGLVNKTREEIAKIDKEYLRNLQESTKFLDIMKKTVAQFTSGELISCAFTSLCRMPLYDADFGWGKPVWIGSPALTFKNLFVFMDEKDGDGIDVYVHLEEEHMMKLEVDEVFLKYAKLPSNSYTHNA